MFTSLLPITHGNNSNNSFITMTTYINQNRNIMDSSVVVRSGVKKKWYIWVVPNTNCLPISLSNFFKSAKKISHNKNGSFTTIGEGKGGQATLWWTPPKTTTFLTLPLIREWYNCNWLLRWANLWPVSLLMSLVWMFILIQILIDWWTVELSYVRYYNKL